MPAEFELVGIRTHIRVDHAYCQGDTRQVVQYIVFLCDPITRRLYSVSCGDEYSDCPSGDTSATSRYLGKVELLPAGARVGSLHYVPRVAHPRVASQPTDRGGNWYFTSNSGVFHCWFDTDLLRATGRAPIRRPVWVLSSDREIVPEPWLDQWQAWFKSGQQVTHQARSMEHPSIVCVNDSSQVADVPTCQNIFLCHQATSLGVLLDRLDKFDGDDPRTVVRVRFSHISPGSSNGGSLLFPAHPPLPFVLCGGSGLGKSFLAEHLNGNNTEQSSDSCTVFETDALRENESLPDLNAFRVVVLGNKHSPQRKRQLDEWTRTHDHVRVSFLSRDSCKMRIQRWYQRRRRARLQRVLLSYLPRVLVGLVEQQLEYI